MEKKANSLSLRGGSPPLPASLPPKFTHLAPLPVSGTGMDGSSGRFSIRSWESETPAFGLFVVAVVTAAAADDDDVDFTRVDEVPRKSTSASRSAVAEPRLEPGGLSLVDPPPPWLEMLLVRRERARRRRPKSVGVVVAVAAVVVDADVVVVSTTSATAAAAPPPSMTSATVVARLLERTVSALGNTEGKSSRRGERVPLRKGKGRSFLSWRKKKKNKSAGERAPA